jgi:hypothetical protein
MASAAGCLAAKSNAAFPKPERELRFLDSQKNGGRSE